MADENKKTARVGYAQYQRRLSGVEKRWVSDLNKRYRDLRARLLDVVDRYGLSPIARREIIAGFEALKADARNLSVAHAEELEEIAVSYVETQIREMKQVGAPIPRNIPRFEISFEDFQNDLWVDDAKATVLGEFRRQRLADEENPSQIFAVQLVGEDGRASAYRKGKNKMRTSTVLATWGVGNSMLRGMYSAIVDQVPYKRQAIASIDERTTTTCLLVHGQTVGMDEYFTLEGTPRFAYRMKEPPFHFYCRTSISLFHEKMDESGFTTEMMQSASLSELQDRETMGLVEIHPAHATSRR